MHTYFFTNISLTLDDSSNIRYWKDIRTNEIICSKDETSSEINIDDLKFSYEIMEEATYVLAKRLTETPLPKDTKIFCHWELNGRECYEDMQIAPSTYSDIFSDAFGKEKNIKIFMLYPNKILFEF